MMREAVVCVMCDVCDVCDVCMCTLNDHNAHNARTHHSEHDSLDTRRCVYTPRKDSPNPAEDTSRSRLGKTRGRVEWFGRTVDTIREARCGNRRTQATRTCSVGSVLLTLGFECR